MPSYYFHTETDSRFTDDEGIECISPDAARKEAIATCGQIMTDCAEAFWGSRPWDVTVTDATGLILWEININGTCSGAGESLER